MLLLQYQVFFSYNQLFKMKKNTLNYYYYCNVVDNDVLIAAKHYYEPFSQPQGVVPPPSTGNRSFYHTFLFTPNQSIHPSWLLLSIRYTPLFCVDQDSSSHELNFHHFKWTTSYISHFW